MIDLITKIFQEAKLQEIENSDFKIFGYKDRKNYWTIIQRNGEEIAKIIEQQAEIFIDSKKIIQDPTFDKNANLLILIEVDSLENLNADLLLKIEENPYHFKKNILYYTNEEKANLIQAIGESKILGKIESMILDEKIFEVHKQQFDKNNFESLIYRMSIKIPFIKINARQTNNLKSLEEINNRSVQNNPLNELLSKEFFFISDEDFNEISEERAFEKLISLLPNENPEN